MQFANVDSLDSVTRLVSADQFNEDLFDEIARYLTREPNSLFREDLPDDYRMQLRNRIEQEQIKRRWESAISERQETELAQIRREHSLAAQLSRMIAGGSMNPQALLNRFKGKHDKHD